MGPGILGLDLDLDPDRNLGPVPIEAHAGATPVLVPTPTDAVLGADLAAGSTVVVGAIAVPPCLIVADTLETGPTQTPVPVLVCLD